MIDPNLLLRNFRNALASGHPNVALLAMATMDEQLTLNPEWLPDDWKQKTDDWVDPFTYENERKR